MKRRRNTRRHKKHKGGVSKKSPTSLELLEEGRLNPVSDLRQRTRQLELLEEGRLNPVSDLRQSPPQMSPLRLPAAAPAEPQMSPLRLPSAAPAEPQMSPLRLPAAAPAEPAPADDTQMREYLQSVCDDANFCTAFGRETDLINTYFNFPSFNNVVDTRTLSKGSNGFVTELVYDKQGYKASAILKTDLERGADNLYLEGYNGMKYINRLAKQFPCWLETYGMYKFNPKYAYEIKDLLYHNDLGDPDKALAIGLEPIQTTRLDIETLSDTCFNNSNASLLIQYINQPISFHKWIYDNHSNHYAINVELPIILFQIYSVLSTLSLAKVFTHYDLHSSNVLLYQIPGNKYITLRYLNTSVGAPIELKTRYIVKIIDYGRAYCPDNEELYNLVCQAPFCNAPIHNIGQDGKPYYKNNKCGRETGYTFFSDTNTPDEDYLKQNFYVTTNHLNTAHDLRLVHILASIKDLAWIADAAWLRLIIRSAFVNYKSKYGTPSAPDLIYRPEQFFTMQNEDGGLLFLPIRTVTEFYWSIANFIHYAPYFYPSINNMTAVLAPYGSLTIDLAFRGFDDIIPMQMSIDG